MDINYGHVFHLTDSDKTFSEVGKPQDVVKTAVAVNALMIMMTFTTIMIPVPFLAPISMILYVISFTVLNIKFSRDFVMAVYQSDNKQIQLGIKRYRDNKKKASNVKHIVSNTLENKYQEIYGIDKQIQKIHNDISTKINSLTAMLSFDKNK